MKVAVIDLGTNTCNLLIAEVIKPGYRILHQSKELVRLGDNKIRNNLLSQEAITRAVNALIEQKKIIDTFEVQKVCVFATSAIRDAGNKIDFLEKISNNSGWVVKVISGEKEADLIFKGVLLALEELENPSVILDIGGGSNELILAHKTEMLWKESQPTGMVRVITQFALSNPLKAEEMKILHNFFIARHKAAFEQCITHNVKNLVGCSGAFDTIADIIDQVNPGEKLRKKQEIKMEDFWKVYKTLTQSTKEQRINMKGMDMVRVDLIVPAMLFIGQFIKETGISQIIQTDYALREGVLYELLKSPGYVSLA
jgi:exopolyphosphatase / guanosine-5'-triphosphate,3'-diphosphate pyrophosphatase